MLSRSGVYALQATLHLAQQPAETCVSAASMARSLSVPPQYLAKVLHRLGREGLLASTRGARGGYRLNVPAAELTVERIVEPFDATRAPQVCLLGGSCDLDAPCTAHLRRVQWSEARRQILADTALSDLLPSPSSRPNGAGHTARLPKTQMTGS